MGCSMGWSAPAQPQLTNNNATADAELLGPWFINLTDFEMSWVASLINLGALIGAIFGGPIMESFGPKAALMFTTFPAGCGWVTVSLAQSPSKMLKT